MFITKCVLLTCLTVLVVDVYAQSWRERKHSHSMQTLSEDQLTHAATMSEDDEHFRSEILKPFMRTRVSDTNGNRVVREHIKEQMSNMGWTVSEDSFTDTTPLGDKTFVNVIAVHDPAVTRRLTLACHYDSKLFTDVEFIGATDSAVPCALMIDIARVLNASLSKSKNPDVTLQLVFFDGEEAFVHWTSTDSLYGSRHLADTMAEARVMVDREVIVSHLETIDVLVLLDLIGSADTKFVNWFSKTQLLYNRLKDIEHRLRSSRLLQSDQHEGIDNHYFTSHMYQSADRYGGIQDDHIPFLQKDVPVIHMIAYPFPSVWHTAADNEAALNFPTITNINRILRVFVIEYLHLAV